MYNNIVVHKITIRINRIDASTRREIIMKNTVIKKLILSALMITLLFACAACAQSNNANENSENTPTEVNDPLALFAEE